MDRNPEKLAIIVLNSVPEMSLAMYEKLGAAFGGAANSIGAPESALAAAGIPPGAASRIASLDRSFAEKEVLLAGKAGARITTLMDADYPESLQGFTDKPLVLYITGRTGLLSDPSVAVVGTRNATSYGRYAASEFSKEFVRAGLTIVSGLARGIDTEAHQAALESGGKTVAVLGNGLNINYPPENRKLQERIASEGALISEFPMNRRADRLSFPRRNRIISGLSLATLVVEADFKSGALITAKCALDQGKDVFAVPGPIYSKTSNGSNFLIKNGASLAGSASDVIDALDIKPAAEPQEAEKGGIVGVLKNSAGAVSIDALKSLLGMAHGDLAKGLFELEVRGVIRSLPGKMYILNN